jgi:hypothetical protein
MSGTDTIHDTYVRKILDKYRVETGPSSPAERAISIITPMLKKWTGSHLNSISVSGSYAKNTVVRSSADIDVFISLSTGLKLKDIYMRLLKLAKKNGWKPKCRNVSIRIMLGKLKVDLTLGRVIPGYQDFHALYKRKQDSWTQTNVLRHIEMIRHCGHTDEIRALKIWRDRLGIEFPSFYLELATIEALKHHKMGIAKNVLAVLRWISENLKRLQFVDPANSNDVISDNISMHEKELIVAAARKSLTERYWYDVLGSVG